MDQHEGYLKSFELECLESFTDQIAPLYKPTWNATWSLKNVFFVPRPASERNLTSIRNGRAMRLSLRWPGKYALHVGMARPRARGAVLSWLMTPLLGNVSFKHVLAYLQDLLLVLSLLLLDLNHQQLELVGFCPPRHHLVADALGSSIQSELAMACHIIWWGVGTSSISLLMAWDGDWWFEYPCVSRLNRSDRNLCWGSRYARDEGRYGLNNIKRYRLRMNSHTVDGWNPANQFRLVV